MKNFRHINVDMEIRDVTDQRTKKTKKFLFISSYLQTYKKVAILNTIASHISNMIKGVTKGFRYKMHLVKKHFPIVLNISEDNKTIEVGKFLGGLEVKHIKILDGVTVSKNEKNLEEIWFDGNDINTVSMNCAHLQQSCKITDKDQRMFLDGIYVSEKTEVEKD